MYFSEPRAHAVPFISSKIVPLQMLYAEKVSSTECLTSPAWMLRLTSVISSLKLIQSTSMRPGFLRLEIIMSKLQDWI